jgi:protein arginine kinase
MSKWYEKSGPESDTVISTRIRLARNLHELPFPVKMNKADRKKLVQGVAEATKNCTAEYDFQFVNMEDVSKVEAVSLVERHLASPEFISECDGRGMLVTEDETVSVMLNGENHLSLQTILEGLNLQRAYQTADQLDTMLEKSLHFAFDETLGYLTQNPVDLGTGMRASLMLHLPALKDGGEISRISTSLSKLGLALRGIYGSGTEPKGAIYQLSNQVTLGLSEQEAITNLESIAMQIITQERTARQTLAQSLDIQDTVSRSLAILQSARIMTNDEFMRLISNVRFGVAAGLIENVNYDVINRLIIEAQPATLMLSSGKKLTPNERHVLRAQMVHNIVKNENKADD